jgi:hypothetical protein
MTWKWCCVAGAAVCNRFANSCRAAGSFEISRSGSMELSLGMTGSALRGARSWAVDERVMVDPNAR